ncbi:MAG: hypothetical protein LBU03_06100 [Tannerellaceae bacterium]|jgi:hypothetical protein|nr:hypothetical protein [Tannerellaceae bacterium]
MQTLNEKEHRYVTEVMTNKALKLKACELSHYVLIEKWDKIKSESATLSDFEKEVILIMVFLSSMRGIYKTSVINCFGYYRIQVRQPFGYLYHCKTVGTTQLDADALIELESALNIKILPHTLSSRIRKWCPLMQAAPIRVAVYTWIIGNIIVWGFLWLFDK